MQYLVIVEKGPTSYGAYVPDLPGCIAVGESREEVLKKIREAIELHLEGLREDGLPIPEPSLMLDGIEGGFLIFQLIAYVQNPRLAGGVRSDLLFTILDELNKAQLPLAAYAAAPMPVAPPASASQPAEVPGPDPGPRPA